MTEIIKNYEGSGLLTTFELVSKDAFNVKRTQDCNPILDLNAANRADSSFKNGYTETRDMQHVARIPLILMEKWWKDAGRPAGGVYGKAMSDIIKAKLNDPEYKYLRTGQGEIR